jgi:energy-coupling factor transporter transmembrane protein EcfT
MVTETKEQVVSSNRPLEISTDIDKIYLQPPPERRYVRSFLFSRRIDALFPRLHLLVRIVLILCLSSLQLRTINSTHPDLILAIILWGVAFLLFLGSGMQARLARLYLLLTLPVLFSLFCTWILFNPVPGRLTLIQLPLFSSLTLLITDRTLLVAVTKVVGYSGMVLATIALVVSARDVELIGALRQLRIPQPVIFFLSTVFRALDLALLDYQTVHQAQIARALYARRRGLFRRLRDLASIAVPMVAMMIRRASEIGDALLARGFSLHRKTEEFYETSPWRLTDWLALLFSLLMLVLALWPHPLATALWLASNSLPSA